MRVTLEVGGFVKRWQKTGEIFEEVPLRMPTYAYDTRACWVDIPEDSTAELAKLGLPMDAGLHAMAHALLSMLPLRLSCDPGDVGCECDALRHRQLWPKRLLLFDKREGGLGIAERAATVLLPLLRDALLLMTECDCKDGCYCCVHSSKCAEYNAGVDKRAAIALTKHVLNAAAAAHLPPAGGSVQLAAVEPSAPACFACAEDDEAQPMRDEGREDEGEGREQQGEPRHRQRPPPRALLTSPTYQFSSFSRAQGVLRRKTSDDLMVGSNMKQRIGIRSANSRQP